MMVKGKFLKLKGMDISLLSAYKEASKVSTTQITNKMEINKLMQSAEELLWNPEYTKYYTTPTEYQDLNRNITEAMSTKYERLLVDVYLPVLSSALDLHIKICEEIQGYVGVVTTIPLQLSAQKKFTMLVLQEDRYNVILRKKPATIVTNFDISQDHPYITNPNALKTPTKEMAEKQKKSHKVEITQVHKKEVIKMYQQTYNITVLMDEEGNDEQNGQKACSHEDKSPTKNNDEELLA